jgi:protein-S-isoprenylcysteine O-methyltransferase Ste14
MDLSMTQPSRDESVSARNAPRERAPVLQWIGLFLPALTFFAHLQIGYLLVPWACATGQDIWIHVAGLLSVVVASLGVLAAWRTWGRAKEQEREQAERMRSRTRFMGEAGVGMGAIFTLILLAQWIAAFFIRSCQ